MKKILEDYAPILNAKQIEGEALDVPDEKSKDQV